ncbi:hypothetical protein MRX96_017109 [Rhipicephalus microplus]
MTAASATTSHRSAGRHLGKPPRRRCQRARASSAHARAANPRRFYAHTAGRRRLLEGDARERRWGTSKALASTATLPRSQTFSETINVYTTCFNPSSAAGDFLSAVGCDAAYTRLELLFEQPLSSAYARLAKLGGSGCFRKSIRPLCQTPPQSFN